MKMRIKIIKFHSDHCKPSVNQVTISWIQNEFTRSHIKFQSETPTTWLSNGLLLLALFWSLAILICLPFKSNNYGSPSHWIWLALVFNFSLSVFGCAILCLQKHNIIFKSRSLFLVFGNFFEWSSVHFIWSCWNRIAYAESQLLGQYFKKLHHIRQKGKFQTDKYYMMANLKWISLVFTELKLI